jgi:hypothetical protein
MFRILFYIFIIYLAYQFVFSLLLPVYRATQQVKKGFRDLHAQAQKHAEEEQTSQAPGDPQQRSSSGDYIDFEEVK